MTQFTALSTIPVMETPDHFIQELVQMKADVRIYDFMFELKDRFYPEINMILYEDLAQYVGRESEFCIDARMFYKYSKLCVPDYEFDIATCDPNSNIKKVLKRSNMKKDKNYRLLHVEEPVAQGGFVKSNRYMMTPDSFYMLLMDIPDRYRRARQTFIKYHAFLSKVIKHYDNFQLGVKELEKEEQARMLTTKDDKIDELSKQMRVQDQKIDQLLAFGNKLVGQNETIQLTLDMTKEELGESLDHLINKSYHSTIDPVDKLKVTYVAVLAPINADHTGKTILVRGQRMQINKKINQYYDTHEPVIDMTYNANAVNLIENSKQKFKEDLKSYVIRFNIPIAKYNLQLKKEIVEYNKKARKNPSLVLRQYALEKRSKLTMSDIPIKFNNTSIIYESNDHISYESVVQTIRDMIEQTQKSPLDG